MDCNMQYMQNMNQKHSIPYHTSTLDFENFVPTSPVLSSRKAGWEGVMVQTYHEPPEVEELTLPTTPDIFLVLVTGGALQVECRDLHGPWRRYQIGEGDWFLMPGDGAPYIMCWKKLADDPIHTLHLHVKSDLFSQAAQQLADHDLARLTLVDRSGFQDPLLAHIGYTLQHELSQPAPAGKLYAETAAQMLAVHLLRYYTTTGASIQEYTQRLSRQQLQHVIEFVLAHLDQDLSLENLARQIGFSAYHFARLFRETTGESPHQFVLRKRIEVACRLLKETGMPLSQVALAAGFPNQSYFTQVFKDRIGSTPRRYRQGH
jgi:AraC family transcriptional regulator